MQTVSLPIASNSKRIGSFVIDDIVVNLFLIIIFSSQIAELMQQMTPISESMVNLMNQYSAGKLSLTAYNSGIQEQSSILYGMMSQFVMSNIGVILAVKVLYHTVLIWQSGMTLGKYIVRIKAVDMQSGQRLSFVQAFWRASVRLVSEMLFYVGFLFAFFSSLHQTLHDKISNSVVIDV